MKIKHIPTRGIPRMLIKGKANFSHARINKTQCPNCGAKNDDIIQLRTKFYCCRKCNRHWDSELE